LAGDRNRALEKLKQEAEQERAEHREEVMREFDREPIVVHLHKQYDLVRNTIFEQ